MNIGLLNKRITLQYPTLAPDGLGGNTTTWETAAEVFAAVWPVSANDTVSANTTSMVISHKIRIRYRARVLSTWRVKYGTRYFSIVSIINANEANKQLDLMCKETA